MERVRREESALCELVDGVLVEKAVSIKTARNWKCQPALIRTTRFVATTPSTAATCYPIFRSRSPTCSRISTSAKFRIAAVAADGFDHGPEVFRPHAAMDRVAGGDNQPAPRASTLDALPHFLRHLLRRAIA